MAHKQWAVDPERLNHPRGTHGLIEGQENLITFIRLERIIGDRLHQKLRIVDILIERTIYKTFETYKTKRRIEVKAAQEAAKAAKRPRPVTTDGKGEQAAMDAITTEFKRCGVSFSFFQVIGVTSTAHATDRYNYTSMMGPAKTLILHKINIHNIMPHLPTSYTDWLQVQERDGGMRGEDRKE
jgi:hypothetical protein